MRPEKFGEASRPVARHRLRSPHRRALFPRTAVLALRRTVPSCRLIAPSPAPRVSRYFSAVAAPMLPTSATHAASRRCGEWTAHWKPWIGRSTRSQVAGRRGSLLRRRRGALAEGRSGIMGHTSVPLLLTCLSLTSRSAAHRSARGGAAAAGHGGASGATGGPLRHATGARLRWWC